MLYVCGSPLFPGRQYQDKIVVRQSLTCATYIETQYYAGITESFDPICFYCGDSQLETNRDIEKLKENFAIVRPVCSSCYNKGMQPATRNAKKTKRQRTN